MAMESYKRGVIAGMELAMRICRNREQTLQQWGAQSNVTEATICVGLIRFVQVEIGAGRRALPEFTIDEQEEMNRIK